MLTRIWYEPGHLLSYLLWPLSLIFRCIIYCRYFFYKKGWLKQTIFPVPVIVVGNITVGGTGKTPLVIALVEWLKDNGWKPGVVSRGYGGRSIVWPQQVTEESDPHLVGDEPLLIKRKTQVPMVVGPKRVADVKQLLAHQSCDVVVSDDGLQHLALGRAVEIAIVDGAYRFGNGFCLPAGPLREPIRRLKKVDFVINNGAKCAGEYLMELKPAPIYQLRDPQCFLDLNQIKKTVHAVAGIGQPQRFFSTLQKLGIVFIPHPFPDHHVFRKKDLDFGPDSLIIMTEKDAVKCLDFADENYWCLPVAATLESTFFQALYSRLLSHKFNSSS